MDAYFLYVAGKLDAIRQGDGTGNIFNMVREVKTWELWRAVLAEFVATMLFVFIGTMSAVDIVPVGGAAQFVRIAFTFGLMIATLIQMFGHVSGAHMNPAVSIAMAVSMTISPLRALLYCIAQCTGGIVGSFILKGVTPSSLHGNLGVTSVGDSLNPEKGFGCELIFTFILVMSIYGCTDSNRPMFGSPALGIGLTITVVHLAGIPFTGASMNPARTLGSAVASNSYNDLWVYFVGPILGGVIASLSYKYVFSPYRSAMSYQEAVNALLASEDVIVVPKSYFGEKSVEKFQANSENL